MKNAFEIGRNAAGLDVEMIQLIIKEYGLTGDDIALFWKGYLAEMRKIAQRMTF